MTSQQHMATIENWMRTAVDGGDVAEFIDERSLMRQPGVVGLPWANRRR